MHSITLLVSMSLIACCLTTSSYNYIRSDPFMGPGAWSTLFPECGGSENSPVDLGNARRRNIGAFRLSNWGTPVTWDSTNSGNTVSFVPNSEPFSTSQGGLDGTYIPSMFHLHWGAGRFGSEHTIFGKRYAAELHLVHRRSTYATLSEASAATKESDREALAVFGIFFKEQYDDNPDIEELITAIEVIQNLDDSAVKVHLPSLSAMYGRIVRGSYFRYDGGLTTPECTEIVVWTVFKTPLNIGSRQLARLQATDTGDFGTELYRPIVPLGLRTIYFHSSRRRTRPVRRKRRKPRIFCRRNPFYPRRYGTPRCF